MAGPMFRVDFMSAPEVKQFLQQANAVVRPAMAAGIYQLGCAIISDSIPRAPKDTGTLRNSAHCGLPKGRGDSVSVAGGYGGFAKRYALVQHENMTYRHSEGGAKYLERAFQQHQPNAAQWLADFMAKAIKTKSRPGLNNLGVPTEPGPKGSSPKKKRPVVRKSKGRK